MPLINLYGRDDIKKHYNSAVAFGIKTAPTAQAILTYLSKAKRDYDVVLLEPDQTFGQMAIAGESNPEVKVAREVYHKLSNNPEFVRPTVFWSPTYEFQYYSDVVGLQPNGNIHTPSSLKTAPRGLSPIYSYSFEKQVKGGGSIANTSVVVRATLSKFPPWVTLFHELGHVKQLYEGGTTAEWKDRIATPAGIDLIEEDNLARHENPICRESNVPVRQQYKFFPDHLADTFKKRPPEAVRVAKGTAERAVIEKELADLANSDPKKYKLLP